MGRVRRRLFVARVNALMAAEALSSPPQADELRDYAVAMIALTRKTDDVAAMQELYIERATSRLRLKWRLGLVVGAGSVLLVWGLVALIHAL